MNYHITPQDVTLLIFNDFIHPSFKDDDLYVPSAKSSVQQKQTTIARKRSRRITGAIPYEDMSKFKSNVKSDRDDVVGFINYDDFVLYNVKETLSPVFKYSFEATKGTMKLSGREILFLCGDFTYEKLPSTPKTIKKLLNWAQKGMRSDRMRQLIKQLMEKLQPLIDSTTIITEHQLFDLVMKTNRFCLDEFMENAKIKQYFKFHQIRLIARYYPMSVPSSMSSCNLDEFSEYFNPKNNKDLPDPAELCFEAMVQKFVSTTEHRKRIEELSLDDYLSICKSRKITPSSVNVEAIKIYEFLKTQTKERSDKFLYGDEMFFGMPDDTKEDVLKVLNRYCAICRDKNDERGGRYYVRRVYIAELMIVKSIVNLGNNAIADSPTLGVNQSAKAPLTKPCSEQLRMINLSKVLPLLIVNGMGGSGKTDGCCFTLKDIKESETLFLTYHSANSANAQERVTKRSYHIHKIMTMHAMYCMDSPYYVLRKQKTKPKLIEKMGLEFVRCPFENIKFVILDEVGIVYDELFAQILWPLIHCGKLCRLVLCGDKDQQPQRREGQLFTDLLKIFKPWNITFQHYHRPDKNNADLFRNNSKAIIERDITKYRFNKTTNILRPIENNLDPALHNRNPARKKQVLDELRYVLESVFKEFNVGDQETYLILSRTNEIRRLVNNIVKLDFHKHPGRGFVKTQKIIYKRNCYDFEPWLFNNELLVIDRIEDVQITCNHSDSKKLAETIVKAENVIEEIENTAVYKMRRSNVFRRVVCHVRGVPKAKRIIPWIFGHSQYVIPAAAVTETISQGLEASVIVDIKPRSWEKADTNLSMNMVQTRARNKIIWISPQEELVKWITTPQPFRRSALAEKLQLAMQALLDIIEVPEDDDDIKEKIKEETTNLNS